LVKHLVSATKQTNVIRILAMQRSDKKRRKERSADMLSRAKGM
jgi:hypothetical protein